jgi:hypothetical protein
METLSVDELAEITGQSGVAIALDDVKVFFYTENEETWYQSQSAFTAADNSPYNYRGALGLIRTDFGQMLYLTAFLASTTFWGALGNLTSVAANAALQPNMKRSLMGPNYAALNATYGWSFGNKSFLGKDDAFDSRALTIRATNYAEVFSLGATYRLDTLDDMGAALGINLWAADYASYTKGTNYATIAAVVIGLPTVEVHYKRGRGETLEVKLSTAADPLLRIGFDGSNQANSDTWTYGKIYYGAQTGGNTSDRTILVLDGFIEIAPLEAYANPKFQ